MSTNENIPASDERAKDTAPVATIVTDDAPEPDITQAGKNLILALVILTIGIGASWIFAASLFKTALSTQTDVRGGGVATSSAGAALAADRAHAAATGSVELEDGTTINYVPVNEGTRLLLGSPDALRGNAQYLSVEGGEIAQLPALPSFEAVLDPAAAAEAAAQAEIDAAANAAAEDEAQDDADEGDAPADDAPSDEAVEPAAAE